MKFPDLLALDYVHCHVLLCSLYQQDPILIKHVSSSFIDVDIWKWVMTIGEVRFVSMCFVLFVFRRIIDRENPECSVLGIGAYLIRTLTIVVFFFPSICFEFFSVGRGGGLTNIAWCWDSSFATIFEGFFFLVFISFTTFTFLFPLFWMFFFNVGGIHSVSSWWLCWDSSTFPIQLHNIWIDSFDVLPRLFGCYPSVFVAV